MSARISRLARSAARAALALAAASPLASRASAADESPALSLKRLSLDELMNLEVTSVSKRPEKLSETASAIQVVTNDDIRRSGASNLPEALRLASNLEVAQVDAYQWAISARGFNSTSANKLLVLMDGRTLYSPLHAAVFWDAQDTLLEDIDRIEVISGPGATQWGANAVNGVINITTRSAAETQGLLLSGGGGTELTGFGGVRYGGKLAPGVYYRIYGKYSQGDRTRFADGHSGANDWSMSQGGFRIDSTATADSQLTLQGDAYYGREGQPALDDTRIGGRNLLGRWSHAFSADSNLSIQGYYDHTYRRIPGLFAEDLDTYDLDLQHQLSLGERHNIVWGAAARLIDDQQHNDYPVLAFLPEHVRRQWFSVFAQDEIALLPNRLHVTVGAKLEHNFYTGYESQPSARLSWRATPNQTLWAAVSRAVRTPSRIDTEFYAPRDPPFTLLQGGPHFTSEKLLAYEFGWRVTPTPRLALALSAYYHDYDRLRSVERVDPATPFPIFLANNQEGSATGAELTADYHATDHWRLRAGYNQLHLELHNTPGSTADPATDTDPEHQFFLRSSWDLPGHLEVDATGRYVAGIVAQNLPDYAELDLRLGWAPRPDWELSLVGQNLLHARHAEFNPLASRQEIARSVYLKVAWRY